MPPPVLPPFPTRRSSDLDPNLPSVVEEEPGHRLGELVRSSLADRPAIGLEGAGHHDRVVGAETEHVAGAGQLGHPETDPDRKSTRLNSSHGSISYAVFCL